MQATGIILAGGKSRRMGTNKALLIVDGLTIIERIAKELGKITTEIIIATNNFEDYQFLNLPMVEDKIKGKGPLAGIQAGLAESKNEKNLIATCDMPFISAKLGAFLLQSLDEYEAAVPEVSGRLHPLYAAYRKETLGAVNRAIADENLKIRHFLKTVNAKIVTENDFPFTLNEKYLYNMNHPEEYEQALRIQSEMKKIEGVSGN
ncbi:formate dehydrogenase family accessory protein FdhD [Bacillus methanolicus PB1]|uniref:Probable molybdenum cofactor guanylyltransferase n=1 Tax=Bacillus methanolicus PB1 TaxID=997296 RepID=I3E167_BACMT|nr:molybdenum cofactor guanylyltransferase [Bacillus methanolicus]EIJ80238.1 formate dehydrogenase family accessory protein FdhD [Bacillus methanolicus PB1]